MNNMLNLKQQHQQKKLQLLLSDEATRPLIQISIVNICINIVNILWSIFIGVLWAEQKHGIILVSLLLFFGNPIDFQFISFSLKLMGFWRVCWIEFQYLNRLWIGHKLHLNCIFFVEKLNALKWRWYRQLIWGYERNA